MLDLVLALVFGGLGQGGWSREPRDPSEQAVAAVGLAGLPVVGFCVVLFARILDPWLALVGLPFASGALVIGLCTVLQLPSGSTLRLGAGTTFASFVACATAWLVAGLLTVFRGF